ncbi:hypothetical protein CUR21_02970 [Pseudorhodobacter sp. MZDSW-24AT]|nr:hypothetical protein CUR21_02970 [Pseudorhodobacter sp. MZDSW-24AT]
MRGAQGGTARPRLAPRPIMPTSKARQGAIRRRALPKERQMVKMIQRWRDAASTYARYRKTRDEIANLPLDVAQDLGLFREDAPRIACAAIYGKTA